jgi:hypothetical protein
MFKIYPSFVLSSTVNTQKYKDPFLLIVRAKETRGGAEETPFLQRLELPPSPPSPLPPPPSQWARKVRRGGGGEANICSLYALLENAFSFSKAL